MAIESKASVTSRSSCSEVQERTKEVGEERGEGREEGGEKGRGRSDEALPSNSSEGTEEQDQAIAHFYTSVLSCVLNNAHAISLPSLEDLEVDNTSIFSLTRDLITFVIRSSSSFGERERREEGRREEKRGGEEGRREEKKRREIKIGGRCNC